MPSPSRAILASAGSGKTTTIVTEAFNSIPKKILLATYTLNGRAELSDKMYAKFGYIPQSVRITTWYTFVLQHFIRPYQAHLHPTRISNINFKRGRTARGIKKSSTRAYFFSGSDRIKLDKVTDFACHLIEQTKGLPIDRFLKLCDHLYIDEAQDLSGYDLELIEKLLRAGLQITLIGDCRQATYTTNDSQKNKAFAGAKIVRKFELWEKAKLLTIKRQCHSYRCIQTICDFADRFHPDFERTQSRNNRVTDHDGLFAVFEKDVDAYYAQYKPQILRYDRKTTTTLGHPLNFGAAKGMTFERVLIYPHGKLRTYLATGNLNDAGKELAKLYVAVTRARQSVAFVLPDTTKRAIVTFFSQE